MELVGNKPQEDSLISKNRYTMKWHIGTKESQVRRDLINQPNIYKSCSEAVSTSLFTMKIYLTLNILYMAITNRHG